MAKDKVKIKFVVSPTGKFGLAYNVGETAIFEEKQASELVESGYASYVVESAAKKETATDKAAEHAEKR